MVENQFESELMMDDMNDQKTFSNQARLVQSENRTRALHVDQTLLIIENRHKVNEFNDKDFENAKVKNEKMFD